MDDNNSFLSSYKKKLNGQKNEQNKEASNGELPSLKYEVKSGFIKPQRKDSAIMHSAGNKQQTVVSIIIAVVVIVGIAIALISYSNRGIEVVDFTNWAVNDAQLWAKDSGVNLHIEEQYNDQIDVGKIISQNPVKGATV